MNFFVLPPRRLLLKNWIGWIIATSVTPASCFCLYQTNYKCLLLNTTHFSSLKVFFVCLIVVFYLLHWSIMEIDIIHILEILWMTIKRLKEYLQICKTSNVPKEDFVIKTFLRYKPEPGLMTDWDRGSPCHLVKCDESLFVWQVIHKYLCLFGA